MKERRSVFGFVLVILSLAFGAYAWNEFVNNKVDPNYGLLDLIKGVGEGIAQRMGWR